MPVLARSRVQPRSPIRMETGSDRRQSAPLCCRASADDRRLDRFRLWRAADEKIHAVAVSIGKRLQRQVSGFVKLASIRIWLRAGEAAP